MKLMLVTALALVCLAASSCHIGSGFDTAEKRRALQWQDETASATEVADTTDTTKTTTKTTTEGTAEIKPPAPIIYLLVAG